MALLDATNSDPYVAVSAVTCLFEYESILPVAKQWFKFASTVVVVVTGLPRGCGISFGMIS